MNEDSSHSFCFCFSEEQRILLKIPLPKFIPELHDLKMPCNKDIICEKRCKEKYPKKKLTIATCVNKYSSHPFCFCLTENSQILLKQHYESELSLPCSDHLICYLRCMKININLKIRSKKLPFSYKTRKCVNNQWKLQKFFPGGY